MPIYVYKNLTTGETFELEQRITEKALSTHPETGDPVKRLIQPVGIAFKGSGFYVTDSRNSNSGKATKSENAENKTETKTDSSSSESKTESNSESKTESKSEAKTESKSESKAESKKETPAKEKSSAKSTGTNA